MNDVLKAAILGIVEGLTEFLPVSSTGHMIIVMPWLGIDATSEPWPTFLYFVQIGAILAVILHFFRKLWRQVFHPSDRNIYNHIITKLFVGMLPAAVIGLPLDKIMEKYLEKPYPVAIALLVGAVVMVLIERRFRRPTGPTIEQVTLRQSFLIGLAQCVSIIPGTSRAMATIMGGLVVGLPATTATEFSFYLAIPTICGAGCLRLYKHRSELNLDNISILAVGFVVSFVVAWIAIAGFLRYIQTHSFKPFAIYRVLLGAAVLAWWLGSK